MRISPAFVAAWTPTSSVIPIVGFNPVISPDTSWEETAVFEPSVIYEGGLFKMWYTGGWDHSAVGYAESADGSIWTKNSSPVLGQGGSGVSGQAVRNNVIKIGSTYYCYYVDAIATNANLKVATSSDGLSWTVVATALAYNVNGAVDGWANTSVWKEGSTWYMLAEGHSAPIWKTFALTSSDGLSWTFLNSGNEIISLQVASGGMYGGPNMCGKIGSTYHLYYHACAISGSLPTSIYHATSTDLINWTITSGTVLALSGTDFEIDQVADACVIEVSGRTYLFYDGDDNQANCANVGLAIFEGTLSSLASTPLAFTKIDLVDYTDPIEFWGMHESSGTRVGAINALDLTNSGTPGSASGGPGSTTYASLTGSQGFSRASEKLIQLGNFNWTLAGWFNVSDNTQYAVVATKYESTQRQFYAYIEPAGAFNGLRLVVYKDLLGTTTVAAVFTSTFGVIANNTWVYLAFGYDADNNNIWVSVNGGTKDNLSYDGGMWPSGTGPLRFGTDGSSNAATRRMERWAFWKRNVSSGELTTLYNSGNGTDWPF